jgi:hypothetical protein
MWIIKEQDGHDSNDSRFGPARVRNREKKARMGMKEPVNKEINTK